MTLARPVRVVVRFAVMLGVAALAGGCSCPQSGSAANIVISGFEPSHGGRVLLWPADDEGVEWDWVFDDPGRSPADRIRRFRLPPTDRDVPAFASGVVHISILLPRDAGRRLRHRASFVLERLDAAHPRASLCLVATDRDLRRIDSIADLAAVGWERPRREEDGAIFIR